MRMKRDSVRIESLYGLVLTLTFSLIVSVSPTNALDCKKVNSVMKNEERYGSGTHKKFMDAFIAFQKQKSNDRLYWRALSLKIDVIKSDIRMGRVAFDNPNCFNRLQNETIRYWLESRNKFLADVSAYLTQPVNREWRYSGYAGYVPLTKELDRQK